MLTTTRSLPGLCRLPTVSAGTRRIAPSALAVLVALAACDEDTPADAPDAAPDAGQGAPRAGDRSEPEESSYVYWGDNHVHTRFSPDALAAMAFARELESTRDVYNACEFARFCSGLDFFVSAEHAEFQTEANWKTIRDQVAQCNDEVDDSLEEFVAYAGFEWTQNPVGFGASPRSYGHKNVHFLGARVDDAPDEGRRNLHATPKPIGSFLLEAIEASPEPKECDGRSCVVYGEPVVQAVKRISALAQEAEAGGETRFRPLKEILKLPTTPDCDDAAAPPGGPCLEVARTPNELFAKLDAWLKEPCAEEGEVCVPCPHAPDARCYADRAVVVGSHGTAWGLGGQAEFARDYTQDDYWPELERYVEVYSKHGSSEVWTDLPPAYVDSADNACDPNACGDCTCNTRQGSSIPCCRRCEELLETECQGLRCREAAVDALTCRGTEACDLIRIDERLDWLDCGNCPPDKCPFQPAKAYAPSGSVQAALATRLRDGQAHGGDERPYLELGFIGATDTHHARPGSVQEDPEFAEIPHGKITDFATAGGTPHAQNSSYWFAGGLAAVHVPKTIPEDEPEDLRHQLFLAFQRREVYATSGPRVKLWFHRTEGGEKAEPMGSVVTGFAGKKPSFRVRAVAPFPDAASCADRSGKLDEIREGFVDETCRGICFAPQEAAERLRIDRLEIVKIERRAEEASLASCGAGVSCDDGSPDHAPDPQTGYCACTRDGESCASGRCVPSDYRTLIHDQPPWDDHVCDSSDCLYTFEETVPVTTPVLYYVRVLLAGTQVVNGDPMRCERPGGDDAPCAASLPCEPHARVGESDDDCKVEASERAWSSPIYVYP